MVVANITVNMNDYGELAALIKAMGDNDLHCNVHLQGNKWEIEVTKR